MDFFIADTHFGHENIVKYCGRPFRDAAEMDEVIIRNWNRVVTREDTVYHLGDFALAHKERVVEYFNALNGRIVLVMGNHDRQRTVTFWKKLGFAEVHKEPLLYGWLYLLSHEPVPSTGLNNIHGHAHGNDHRGESTGICVSCEAVGYTPRMFKELMGVSQWKS